MITAQSNHGIDNFLINAVFALIFPGFVSQGWQASLADNGSAIYEWFPGSG
jgi:hypothetical protein